ncbi:MAG: DUF1538 family protein [Rhodospirillales bacterium]|nr:DUF1538 family protein [Rhodospirillales bacterium]
MELLSRITVAGLDTVRDEAPLIGLALFLVGLEQALFPLGKTMAAQLTDPAFLGLAEGATAHWLDYGWIYAFAAAIGFGTTIAEPALLAVAEKAGGVSGGTIKPWGLRIAVAIGVAVGVGLAANVPGRSPLIDGFGLIAFASVFPIIAVLGYAQLSSVLATARGRGRRRAYR